MSTGGYFFSRDVRAGCWDCDPSGEATWTAKNAQGVAAIHARKHGHHTWVEVYLSVQYGKRDAALSKESDAKTG